MQFAIDCEQLRRPIRIWQPNEQIKHTPQRQRWLRIPPNQVCAPKMKAPEAAWTWQSIIPPAWVKPPTSKSKHMHFGMSRWNEYFGFCFLVVFSRQAYDSVAEANILIKMVFEDLCAAIASPLCSSFNVISSHWFPCLITLIRPRHLLV